MVVADIGCGTGFFTVPLAALVEAQGPGFCCRYLKEMINDVKKESEKGTFQEYKSDTLQRE